MTLHLVNIAGDRVAEATFNVRLGLGSFNEKVVQPFASETLDIGAPSPRPGRYAFRHSVNLTSNSIAFAVRVCVCMFIHNYVITSIFTCAKNQAPKNL